MGLRDLMAGGSLYASALAARQAEMEKQRALTGAALEEAIQTKSRALRNRDHLDVLADVVPLRWDRLTTVDRVLGWFGLCRLKRLTAAQRAVDILMSTHVQ